MATFVAAVLDVSDAAQEERARDGSDSDPDGADGEGRYRRPERA
jgi:hypothetical protein